MKKELTYLLIMMFSAVMLYAQDDATIPGSKPAASKEKKETSSDGPKGFIAINMGTAIPTSDFGDTNSSNFNSGFAVSGLTFSLTGGYVFYNGLGAMLTWGGSAHYTEVDGIAYNSADDIWSTGILLVGPMYMGSSGNIVYEGHVQLGRVVGITPNYFGGETASDTGFGIGGSLKYRLGSKFAVGVNLDYITGEPYFEYAGWSQKISAINFTGGIGFLF